MESIEVTGKTVEEATLDALEQLGASRNEVKVTILKESKHGILGLGSEEARILVEPILPQSEIVIELSTPTLKVRGGFISTSLIFHLLKAKRFFEI